MTTEVKRLIKQFEDERDSIVAFTDEVERQVTAGQVTRAVADEIIRVEFTGHDPKQLLKSTNEHIAQARQLLATERPQAAVSSAVPVALILVVAAAIIVNFGAITGFFTFGSGESFYAIAVDQSVTADTTIPLAISDPVSSLRVDGAFEGTGRARIYLDENGTRLLVASFDAREGASGLTGNVVDENGNEVVDLVNETAPQTPSEPTNVTTETPIPETPVVEEPVVEPSSNESTTTEEPTTPDTPTEPASPTDPVTLPATPQEGETPVVENTPEQTRTESLENACVETCELPALRGPHALVIDVTGDVTVSVDRIVFGTRGDLVPEPEVEVPLPVEPVAPVNPPPQTNSTNSTNSTVPTNTTVPVLGDLGAPCSDATQCESGVCIESRYEGTLTGGLCAASANVCVANGTLHAAGENFGDSACVLGSQGTAWLVRGGRGRFVVETAEGLPAAAIDKYGTMVVSGPATFSTTAGTSGWLIKDSSGAVTLSIDETGVLRSQGTLKQRTTPQRTAAGDFVIRTAQGVDAAVITPTGDVSLLGDFISGAQLQ